MGRRLLFLLGLAAAVCGGLVVQREGKLNAYCNAVVARPSHGFTIPPKCVNIVWPYAEGFCLVILGAIFVFAALMLSRRVMSGERQYMKDLKAGKYSRENDHNNSYNFNIQVPTVKIGSGARGGLYDDDRGV